MPETKPDDMRDTPTILRERRLALRMTQGQLAGAAGLTRKTVIRAEGGSPVSLETLKAMCAVLELDSSTLPAGHIHHAPGVPIEGGSPTRRETYLALDDIPEDTHGQVRSVSGFVKELAPTATALAVTDVRAWRQRYYRERVRFPPVSPESPDAGTRLISRRATLMLCAGLASLLGPMISVVYTFYASIRGMLWARDVIAGLNPFIPDHPNLAAMVGGAEIMGIIISASFLAGHFFVEFIRLQTDLEWAIAINKAYDTMCRRFYLAGPDGLRVCEVRLDGSISVTHLTPCMVSACEITGPSERPTIRLYLTAGRTDPATLDACDRASHTYRSDLSSYEIPDIAGGGKLLAAMGSFKPTRDALCRTRVVRTADIAMTAVSSPA